MYYLGETLERKIKQYGPALQTLRDYIVNTATDPQGWPGTFLLEPDNHSDLTDLRFTVYSIIHSLGAKPYFRVKVVLNTIQISYVEQKKVKGGVQVGQTDGFQPTQIQSEEDITEDWAQD